MAAVSFITGSSLLHYCQQSPSPPITCIMRHVGCRILEQPLAAWLSQTEPANRLFKASDLWADAFYKSKCPSVCLSVCLFTFEVPFKRRFAPTS